MHFSGDLVLRTHMRMNGSWHIYRPGERWQRPRRDMRVLIATDDFEAVGFNIPVAEFIRTRDLERHEELRRLGPDVLSDTFSAEEAIRRLQERAETPVADAVLNQRVLAGLGNVYKSEVLFMCRRQSVRARAHAGPGRAHVRGRDRKTSPQGERVRSACADDDVLRASPHNRARRAEGAALGLRPRGLPCRRCGTSILVKKQGPDARLTYWCPVCQA